MAIKRSTGLSVRLTEPELEVVKEISWNSFNKMVFPEVNKPEKLKATKLNVNESTSGVDNFYFIVVGAAVLIAKAGNILWKRNLYEKLVKYTL